MRIFNSSGEGDAMLLGSEAQLESLHRQFIAFVNSPSVAASFAAETAGSAEPYSEFLGGLRAEKRDGDPTLSISTDRWLELSASHEDMCRFGETLLVKESEGHAHWYCKPVSLIIEADSTWREDNES